MTSQTAIAQVNIRMPRELKERGDATLSLVGSSPAKIIRLLWERLAEGGEAYERVVAALSAGADASVSVTQSSAPVQQSASLFKNLGASLGLDIDAFEPDARPENEVLEALEWERFEERGLS